MATISTPAKKATQFPASSVSSALRAELIQSIKDIAAVTGMVLPSSPTAIAKAEVDIDSLLAVSLLCTVEPLIGFDLPERVVLTGGYKSVEAAIEHLLPRIEAEWKKRNGEAK